MALLYDLQFVNKAVFRNKEKPFFHVYKFPSTARTTVQGKSNILASEFGDKSVGRTSGDYVDIKEERWFKVNLIKPVDGRSYGYIQRSRTTLIEPLNNENADKQATQLISDLVNSDVQVYQKLMLSAELIEKAKATGNDVKNHQTQFEALNKRYTDRQTKIKTSKLIKVKQWINDAWGFLTLKYTGKIGEVGVAPIIVAAVGGAVALGAAALIYYSFKPDYEDSKADLKTSAELEKALASLTPQEAAKLKENLEGQVDDAYNQGKTDQAFSGLFGSIKIIGIAALAIYALSKLKPNSTK